MTIPPPKDPRTFLVRTTADAPLGLHELQLRVIADAGRDYLCTGVEMRKLAGEWRSLLILTTQPEPSDIPVGALVQGPTLARLKGEGWALATFEEAKAFLGEDEPETA